jgi:phosphoribosylglycinamide formyltransferase-1
VSTAHPLRLAVIISGRGSNMLAIAKACASGEIDDTKIVKVIADRESSGGIAAAGSMGLATRVINFRSFAGKAAFETALIREIEQSTANLVVLAGFMKILSPRFTARFSGRLLNIHPSLLPAYTGLQTHQRALDAGDGQHGATVHFVTSELDGGPLVLQARVAVRAGDTKHSLSARVQSREHIIYPRVIAWLASGRLQWRDGMPWLDGKLLLQPVLLEESDS